MGSKRTGVTPPRLRGGAPPAWLRATVAYCLAALVALAATVAQRVLLSVGVVTFAVVAALLLAALISPLTSVLIRRRVPSSLSALVSVLLVRGVPVGVGLLLVSRASDQFGQLQAAVTRAIDDLRRFLVVSRSRCSRSASTSCATLSWGSSSGQRPTRSPARHWPSRATCCSRW